MDAGIEQHLAAGRHARAFDLIVPEYKERVFRLAWTILRHRAAAEDATQETLVRVWKALPGFDGRAQLGTWIYAITRNTCLMELRKRRPTVSFDDPDSTEAQHAAASVATGPAADPEHDNLLRLLELAEEVKALVESRQLEMGHARALLGLAQARQQIEVALLVAKKGLSVRETEALVRKLSSTKPDTGDREPPRPDPNITRLEQDLTDKLGAKVHLQHGPKGRGKLVINYNSLDELDGILAHIQ